jgi:hypothetical protein
MLIDCKALAEKELRDRENGIPGESTISQLRDCIIPEMEQLIENEDNNVPLPFPKYGPRFINSFANAFGMGAWQWDVNNHTKLFDKLTLLNTYYENLRDFKRIARITLIILHMVFAIGLTIYSAINISETTNAEFSKTICIISLANFAASLLIWALLSHIIKRELYWLIGGFDDSQQFDKIVLNTMFNKMINAVIISFFAVTLSQVPFLFIMGNASFDLLIGVRCGLYFLMIVWVCVIVLKYQKRALIKN